MSKPNIAIIIGTTRQGRYADIPAQWLNGIAANRTDMLAEVVDLRDHPLPNFDEPISPVYRDAAAPAAQAWNRAMDGYDGFVFLTAEYNHGLPAVLKNALDHSYRVFNRKPAAMVGYGGVGGARAIEHLRLVCIELQMAPIRSAVHIGREPFVASMKGDKGLEQFEDLNAAASQMLDELVWWSNALNQARQ